ncbi:MAG: hypothetical protein M3O41_08920 [Pseudomonadota bacterium]|nr:hypothetical protein [Pseudomonadota bacterium]
MFKFSQVKQRMGHSLFGRFTDANANTIAIEFNPDIIKLGSYLAANRRGAKAYVGAIGKGPALVLDFAGYPFVRRLEFTYGDAEADTCGAESGIYWSVDAVDWHPIAQLTARSSYPGGGRRRIDISRPFPSRYIAFHFDRMQLRRIKDLRIEQELPAVRFGRLEGMCVGAEGFTCKYFSTHTYGLFSNCSTALADVIRLSAAGVTVKQISFAEGMLQFKDDSQKDVYPVFFQASNHGPAVQTPVLFDAQADNHKHYRHLPLEELGAWARMTFWPSASIQAAAVNLMRTAGVDPARTLAVYYRGTDKSSEITLASVAQYISAIETIERETAAQLDILIQTDQEQVRETIVRRFGARARFFQSIPTTRGSVGIHDLDFTNDLKLSREGFSVELIAAVFVISQCAHVLTATSNVGLWIALYRGNARQLYQFGADGELVSPPA